MCECPDPLDMLSLVGRVFICCSSYSTSFAELDARASLDAVEVLHRDERGGRAHEGEQGEEGEVGGHIYSLYSVGRFGGRPRQREGGERRRTM